MSGTPTVVLILGLAFLAVIAYGLYRITELKKPAQTADTAQPARPLVLSLTSPGDVAACLAELTRVQQFDQATMDLFEELLAKLEKIAPHLDGLEKGLAGRDLRAT
jgi:hypothetical protein